MPTNKPVPADSYDYIIAGGGSAGCVLANRLSAHGAKVLILEAGRADYAWDLFIHMPAALTIPIGNPLYDWRYHTEPEPYMNGRRVYHARGKVLGGSSSINGMIFQRGNPLDYERWGKDPGMTHWDYAHCLPYFKKMESCLAGSDAYRGGKGPLILERGPANNPLFGAFLQAAQQAGYPLTQDVNGFQQEGFARFDRNIYKGRRYSAARAYYHPIKKRVTLTTCALVHKVLFQDKRAIGVQYQTPFSGQKVAYGGEVILCAGAFGSPQLLQLSGVGDGDHLKSLGIPVVEDLKGVGMHLQDHLEVYIQHLSKEPVSLNPALKWWRKPDIGLRWLLFRSGPAATNHFEAGGFIRSNSDVAYPNLMIHFLPLAVRYDGSQPTSGHGYQIHIGPMYSDARGHVRIKSKDPREHPSILFNYLSTEQDRREWIEAIRRAREILGQAALDSYNGGEISPGKGVQTDEEILAWVAKDAETALHPSCSARMGVDAMSVLNPNSMEVHGLKGLRVVDASSMPYITNGNIYAPIMMLAEKASDLILKNTPLAAEAMPFFNAQINSVISAS